MNSLLRLVTFETLSTGKRSIGALLDNGRHVVDFASANSKHTLPLDMRSFLNGGKKSMRMAVDIIGTGSGRISVDEVKICAPISDPQKIIAVGLNYKEHAIETKMAFPSEPVVFTKFTNAIIGPNDNIVKPTSSDQVDYEVELVIVIGRECHNVSESTALDYVAGYTVGNDVTARDWQFGKPGGQWSLSKSFNSFSPIGPAIVVNPQWAHLDTNTNSCELDPNNLSIKSTLNGRVMQQSNTKELIFNVQQVVSYLSKVVTLSPGDLIFTGTPYGVGFTRTPPIFLQPGDTISCSIEHLGTLTNKVVGQSNL
ncbi:hypothetical protein SAMD00019534_044360 [Acytostelium subglobosum LB1]|uniref:hypothetical protein n=1 Tax=Acytostelium subglobosum LB1 TaxID=1410327 RepID=UPI000644BEDD|nr:hypothetical protein SAMD00019534_044360 [Acytostelium subglobosum LB1]GAM21261.1 hypothetical protein SAMD00019534_044360 [Acytostelium subglobosum LB1]|eukprot:XP_012755380.1 hypothetical protein SAMD00019534_044360 [Acytostelium subglobosum LB1]